MSDILSINGFRWQERPHTMRAALAIAQAMGLPEIIGRILASRDIDASQAPAFLEPTLRDLLPDPFHLKDMEKAARRIAREITAETPSVAIFGDYDVDGATSSALLARYFRLLGINPLVYIPDRMKEGYGPNTAALLELKAQGARLVITVDCGTLSFEPLAAAKRAGLDVIVVDHHKGDSILPECYAVVNPNRYDETSKCTQLAACGVAFLVMVAVNKLLRAQGTAPPDLIPMLDIVALGTICDVVPLTGVNRAFVCQGLKVMNQRGNKGIAALQDIAGLKEAANSYHAGFVLGPRINAGGRVGKSDLGVRLLATQDEREAREIALQLDQFNKERKAIETLVQEEAMQDALALPPTDAVIIVARDTWHPGVIGIVAGRLKEHFHKPVAVIALENGIGKASARSILNVDLGAAVIAAVNNGLLAGGGGHAMAAGFTIEEKKIEALRGFLNGQFSKTVTLLSQERKLFIDGITSLKGMNAELVRLLDKAGPFGAGNPSVRLMLRNVRIVKSDIIGDTHVRAFFAESGAGAAPGSLKAMAFRSAATPLGQALLSSPGKNFHIAGQAKINVWQGRESVDFFIDDAAFAG